MYSLLANNDPSTPPLFRADFNSLTNTGCCSCYSHAVAIGEGSFLSALSPKPKDPKTAKATPTTLQGGEIDEDEEDTEEEIEEMLKELETATNDLEQGAKTLQLSSQDEKLLKKLLLKIRGFIAKVKTLFPRRTDTDEYCVRFAARHKQRSISRNAA
jgi:hypothetical protein